MRAILAFFMGALLCAPIFATTKYIDRGESQEYVFYGESIATGSYLERFFPYVGNLRSIDFRITSTNPSTTIATANAIWKTPDGDTLLSEIIYSGIPIIPKSQFLTVRIYNPSGSVVSATGNILLNSIDKGRKRIVGNISLDIPNSSTTVTVDSSTKGYWYFRTNAKVYIDWAGGTATSDDTVFNAGDAIDTYPVYLRSGDVIKAISDTGTANIRGFIYE